MKMFLSQKKYEIIASVAVITTLCVLFYFIVPAAKSAAETFFMARSEIKMSESVQNADAAPAGKSRRSRPMRGWHCQNGRTR